MNYRTGEEVRVGDIVVDTIEDEDYGGNYGKVVGYEEGDFLVDIGMGVVPFDDSRKFDFVERKENSQLNEIIKKLEVVEVNNNQGSYFNERVREIKRDVEGLVRFVNL